MRRSSPRVLSFTTLFPNPRQPTHGIFVRERILALGASVELQVVAPVPWFPRTRVLGERYYQYSTVPLWEELNGTRVLHPRFVTIPRFGKSMDGILLAAGVLSSLRRVRNEFPFDIIDAHWAYPDGVAAAILARRLGVPFSLTVRGDDVTCSWDNFGDGVGLSGHLGRRVRS